MRHLLLSYLSWVTHPIYQDTVSNVNKMGLTKQEKQ